MIRYFENDEFEKELDVQIKIQKSGMNFIQNLMENIFEYENLLSSSLLIYFII